MLLRICSISALFRKGAVLLGGNCSGVSGVSLGSEYACMLFAFVEKRLVLSARRILNFVICWYCIVCCSSS